MLGAFRSPRRSGPAALLLLVVLAALYVAAPLLSSWMGDETYLGGGVVGVVVVDAAHSRRRSVGRAFARNDGTGPIRYDRSITTFDPSGRLLQVEYGTEAAARGSTVVAALLEGSSAGSGNEGSGGGGGGICLVVERSPSSGDGGRSGGGAGGGGGSIPKVHRLADHVWLATSGLAGDASSLASVLRSFCHDHALACGEVPSTARVAQEAARRQHGVTRTGGRRPLGCTAIVVGVDPTSTTTTPTAFAADGDEGGRRRPSPLLRIFRSDPGGGGPEDCRYCAAGRGRGAVMSALAGRRYDDLVAAAAVQGGDSPPTSLLAAFACGLVRVIASEAVGNKATTEGAAAAVDVWLIRFSPGRRGDVHATCYLNVRCDDPEGALARKMTAPPTKK